MVPINFTDWIRLKIGNTNLFSNLKKIFWSITQKDDCSISVFYRPFIRVEGISLREKLQWTSTLVSIPGGFCKNHLDDHEVLFSVSDWSLNYEQEDCHQTPGVCPRFAQRLLKSVSHCSLNISNYNLFHEW